MTDMNALASGERETSPFEQHAAWRRAPSRGLRDTRDIVLL
jgi:hypothetical protein